MDIQEFTRAVNLIARDYVDAANDAATKRGSGVRVVYHEYSPVSLARYHARGLTPTQTLAEIIIERNRVGVSEEELARRLAGAKPTDHHR